MVGAIAERNYPLIQAAILLATVGFVVVNFLVDRCTSRPIRGRGGMNRNPCSGSARRWSWCRPPSRWGRPGSRLVRSERAGHSGAADRAEMPRIGSAPIILAAHPARMLFGYRTLFVISAVSVLGALLAGGGVGVAAAWRGGWFDEGAMRLMDVLFAFPIILLAIGIIAVFGPSAFSTAIAIGVVYTPIFARTLRAPALLLKETEYVAAACAVGATDARILARHLLPNLSPIMLVQTSLRCLTAMLVEAALSFLGLGTQPPTASLGRMLAESRNFLNFSPWPAVFSGAAILLAALGLNLLGDGLQDRLDPRLRSRQ